MEFLDEDFLLALELQEQLDRGAWQPDKSVVSKTTGNLSIVDESWETIDPNPDIRELFIQFNKEFFWGKLAGIEVKWSPRMTLCAGLCVYEGRGGLCSVRLSLPLLKLRPRRDLVETLLHEMIHAYLFVTDNDKDHDGHGPEFHKHMYRINNATGTKISVYHNFHDEVDHFRQHWWRCNGPCQNRKPFFGYVKRAMNRAPSERDPWWSDHKRSCNGTFIKIKEPEGYGKKKTKEKSDKKSESAVDKNRKKVNPDIRSFLGKAHVLHSGQAQQKVIVNGVLKSAGKSVHPSSSTWSTEKSDKSNSSVHPSTSTRPKEKSDNSNSSLNTSETSTSKISVNAIKTSGKISDKELVRQQKLAELMMSDSDDDDLILCDGPETKQSSDTVNTSNNFIISHVNSNNISSPQSSIDMASSDDISEKIKSSDIPSRSVQLNKSLDRTQTCGDDSEKESRLQTLNSRLDNSVTGTRLKDNNVISKVRSVWANKQFGSSLKPLDPKADGLSLVIKTQGIPSGNKQYSNEQTHPKNSHTSGKRLSSDENGSNRKKIKIGNEQECKMSDIYSCKDQGQSSVADLAMCPVCNKSVPSVQINQHLDICLGMN